MILQQQLDHSPSELLQEFREDSLTILLNPDGKFDLVEMCLSPLERGDRGTLNFRVTYRETEIV